MYIYLCIYMLHTVVRAYVESYGVSLTSSSLPPHRPDTILFPGISIKDSATSTSVTHATSLSFPLKVGGSGDINVIKQHSLPYNNTTTTTPTTPLHTNSSNKHTTSISNKGGQNYVPAENIIIKNIHFTQLIEGDIKNNIIYQFCNNLDCSLFEVKLLGGRLFECTGANSSNSNSSTNDSGNHTNSMADSSHSRTSSGNNNSISSSVGTTSATVLIRDEPTSLEVAENKPNYDQFCGTICIQVGVYIYRYTYIYSS